MVDLGIQRVALPAFRKKSYTVAKAQKRNVTIIYDIKHSGAKAFHTEDP